MATYAQNYVGCNRPAGGMVPGLSNIIKAINACPPVPGIRYPLMSGFNVRTVAGTKTLSLHACGRAHDIMIKTLSGGDVMAAFLIMMGSRIGLQEVIFNHKRWTVGGGWQGFKGDPHTDHVHWSINPDAANLSAAEATDAVSPLLCGGGAYAPISVIPGGGVAPVVVVPLPPAPPSGGTIPSVSAIVITTNQDGCGSVTIKGNAQDGDRFKQSLTVNFFIDGHFAGTAATNSDHGFSVDIVNLTLGSHALQIQITNPPGPDAVVYDSTIVISGCVPTSDQINGQTEVITYLTADQLAEYKACEVELGCGDYDVQIMEMGGQYTHCGFEAYESLRFNRILDEVSEATVTFLGAQCCECLKDVNPWQHELVIFRNGKTVWTGPIRTIEYDNNNDTVTVSAKDLFSWFDVRMIPRSPEGYYSECADLAVIFRDVIIDALTPDSRPNMTLSLGTTGIRGTREYDPEQFRVAGDELRELSRNGIDFTMINRIIFCGDIEVPGEDIPFMIDEHWVESPVITVGSADMATRTIVGGGGSGADGFDVIGVYPGATGGEGTAFDATFNPQVQEYGLIERLWSESAIDDECDEDILGVDDQVSIDNAARTRWDLLSVPTITIEGGKLAESAPFSLNCLIPGRRVRVSLSSVCRPLESIYRISEVEVDASADGDTVSVRLQPLGTIDSGASRK